MRWLLLLAGSLALVAVTTCAKPPPAPARPPPASSGVADELPRIYWWYAPDDQACPVFRTARACHRAMEDRRCVQRRGLRYPCTPIPEP